MKDDNNIIEYNETIHEYFEQYLFIAFDLWSIRPLYNIDKTLLDGSSSQLKKFNDFISEHQNKKCPFPIIIIFGNSDKSNLRVMLSRNRKYFKIRFKNNPQDIFKLFDADNKPFALNRNENNNCNQKTNDATENESLIKIAEMEKKYDLMFHNLNLKVDELIKAINK
ncbi:MAG: hypothetical protein A2046_06860 [Bacteroidetes bacterium GWA2_30_7]|nr:MAG: hypothetical protein A2046_06860 [Bacteroidetes bacterium GWA2_30_7]